MIYEILEKSKQQHKLVGIKLYGQTGYWCGIVEDYNEDFIQLKHFTKNGELDGVAIERIIDIERIDIEDNYLTAMKIVIENRQKIRDIEIKSRIFTDLDDENWQFVSLKPYENDKNVLISVQINGDDFYQGFVTSIDDDFLKFELIDNNGDSNGISVFKLEDISSVKINDLECRRRLLIYKTKSERIS